MIIPFLINFRKYCTQIKIGQRIPGRRRYRRRNDRIRQGQKWQPRLRPYVANGKWRRDHGICHARRRICQETILRRRNYGAGHCRQGIRRGKSMKSRVRRESDVIRTEGRTGKGNIFRVLI